MEIIDALVDGLIELKGQFEIKVFLSVLAGGSLTYLASLALKRPPRCKCKCAEKNSGD